MTKCVIINAKTCLNTIVSFNIIKNILQANVANFESQTILEKRREEKHDVFTYSPRAEAKNVSEASITSKDLNTTFSHLQ